MPRTVKLKRTEVVEWAPAIPLCARCSCEHWRQWYVRMDDGSWVGAPCLTEQEIEWWTKPEAVGHGKVSVPVT